MSPALSNLSRQFIKVKVDHSYFHLFNYFFQKKIKYAKNQLEHSTSVRELLMLIYVCTRTFNVNTCTFLYAVCTRSCIKT